MHERHYLVHARFSTALTFIKKVRIGEDAHATTNSNLLWRISILRQKREGEGASNLQLQQTLPSQGGDEDDVLEEVHRHSLR